jgi:hypothetical protein
LRNAARISELHLYVIIHKRCKLVIFKLVAEKDQYFEHSDWVLTIHYRVTWTTQTSAIALQNKWKTERIFFIPARYGNNWHRFHSFVLNLLQNLLHLKRRKVFVQINYWEARILR